MKGLTDFELVHEGGDKVLPDDCYNEVDFKIIESQFFLLQN